MKFLEDWATRIDLDALTPGWRPYILLLLMMAALSLPGVFSMPVMDRDEARFAQASAQMLETGDLVVIRFHDDLRNKKPVGIHWLQAASVATFSDVTQREIWAYRLPSFLGSVFTACGLFWCASAMFSRRAAFLAGALAGMTLLVSSEAHIAKTDAALVGCITMAMAALARLRAPRIFPAKPIPKGAGRAGDKRLSLVFWTAFGLGALIKGPVAPMVIGLACATLVVFERRTDWLRPLAYWPGPLIATLLIVPWFVAVQLATDGAFLHEAVGVDLGPKMVSGAEGHAAPPGTHLLGLPFLFWPSTLFLAPGVSLAVSRLLSRNDGPDRPNWLFVAAWAVPCWIVFEAMPTKLVHYTMPAYPALAIAAGAALDRMLAANTSNAGSGFARWLSFVLFLIAGAALAWIMSPWGLSHLRNEAALDFGLDSGRVSQIWRDAWRADGAPVWPFVLTVAATAFTALCFIRRLPKLAFVGAFACAVVTGVSLRTAILPHQDWILATPAAIDALNAVGGEPEGPLRSPDCAGAPPQIVRAVAFAEPSLVFRMGGRIVLPPKTSSALPPRAEDARPVWLLDLRHAEGRAALKDIAEQAAEDERCVLIARRFVKNYSNNDASELAAVAVEPDSCAVAGDIAASPRDEPEPAT